MGDSRFEGAFARWARRIRLRQGASRMLTGAAAGAIVGAAAAGALWKARLGELRPWTGAIPVAFALGGAVLARKRRFTDQDVALYLDGRLGTGEAIATALEQKSAADDDAAAVVLTRATDALDRGDPKRARPPVLAWHHVALPVGIAAIAWLARLPVPAVPAPPPPPGSDQVTLADVKGLERVAELGALSARDDEQRKRLEKIAKDARALQEKLKKGVERREALDEIARLRDEVQSERLGLGDGESRQGLEAALSRLAKEPLTKDAAKALGDRDLVRFDEEMQKLANSREKADRDRARKALEEAAEAAKKSGAGDVAKTLEKEKELLDKRGERADELRELAKALEGSLTDEQKEDLKEFGSGNGDDKSAKKLSRSLEDALKKLTPEERKRLAENLKKRMAQNGAGAAPSERLKDLAKDLDTPEGQKALEDELKKLANEGTESDEAERQKKLGDAEKGLGEAQKGLGGIPMPMPMPGGDGAGKPGTPSPSGSGDTSSPGRGGTEDKGTGDHKGQSQDVRGDELRARAAAKIDGKAPSAGVTMGRTSGRAGDTANVQGQGAIGRVGPSEVNGVDQSEVPEEYREQVGRYFQP